MAIKTIRTGATAIAEDGVLQFITDLLKGSGIFDITTTQMQVTPGSGLQILVAVGRAYLLASAGNGYPVIVDASTGVTISANASGNPRYTSIALYIDLGASANSTGTNVAKLLAIDGTPAASPSKPSDSDIQAAVGASNPFIRLADVLVASGAASFITANITDTRPQVTFRSGILNQDQWIIINATTASTTIDLSKGKKFIINLQTATTTLVLLNVPLTQKSIAVRPVQDSTGGRLVTWWGNLKWPDGVTPTLTLTANKADEFGINFLTVTSDSVNTSEGFTMGQNL